jgi:hypothetical protein
VNWRFFFWVAKNSQNAMGQKKKLVPKVVKKKCGKKN